MFKDLCGRKPHIFYYDCRNRIYLDSDLLNIDFLTNLSGNFYIIVFPLANIVKEIPENALDSFRTLFIFFPVLQSKCFQFYCYDLKKLEKSML